jgi:LmeA-like phospholipid-binding
MTDATQPTEPIGAPAPSPEAAPPSMPPARHRRRGLWLALWIALSLVVLVVLYFVADGLARAYAENRVKAEIEQNLPDFVSGDVSVHIGGTSVIAQYLSGSFEQVTLDAPKLTVQGIPLSASVVAKGVPVDVTKPVSDLAGTITISQSSINSLLRLPGATGDLALGEGTLQYDGTTTVLGLPIGYKVTVEPTANGESILLMPTKAEVTAGGGNLDLSRLLGTVVGSKPLSVCVAQYLPEGVQVDDVTVHPGEATIHLTAHDLVLSQSTLSTKGTCS